MESKQRNAWAVAKFRLHALVAAVSVGAACDSGSHDSALESTGASGSSAATAGDCGCATVAPEWKLRDADDAALSAIVVPYSGLPPDFGTTSISSRCAYVRSLDGGYVDAPFALDTGRIEDCLGTVDFWPDRLYQDPTCTGTWYDQPGAIQSLEMYRRLEQYTVGELLYYSSDAPVQVQAGDVLYARYVDACTATIVDSDMTLYEWKPVPDWVRDLLPNAPYTLTLE